MPISIDEETSNGSSSISNNAGSSSPLSSFQTYGWIPNDTLSEDDNMMDLVLLITRNSQLRQGSMACILLQPAPPSSTHNHHNYLQDRIVMIANNQSLFTTNSSDVHAEMVAIATAAKRGIPTQELTAYITMPPCKNCFAALVVAGISRIVTRYSACRSVQQAAAQHHVELVMHRETPEQTARLKALVEMHHQHQQVLGSDDPDGGEDDPLT